MLGRVLQHELDHLDGILLLERLEKDQRKEAMRILRDRAMADIAGDGLSAGSSAVRATARAWAAASTPELAVSSLRR